MPDSTITAPVAADPIDRLALGAADVRDAVTPIFPSYSGMPSTGSMCMAEE